jgi:hypothetical protein
MASLAPIGHPPPDYASGVAYPAFGVILLTLAAPDSFEAPDLEAVLTHELSHVAVHRAVAGNPLPRWFEEGVAIYEAGEYRIPRMQALMGATLSKNLVPLASLSDRFPSRPFEVNVAYAQSADMVSFLRHEDDGQRFRELIHRLRAGASFEDGVSDVFGQSLPYLETLWREKLLDRYQALPLLVGGSSIMALIAIFAIFAAVKRKARDRKRLAEWAAEERANAHALHRLEQALDRRLKRPLEEPPAVPPPRAEPGVPTVHHEGKSHTLH